VKFIRVCNVVVTVVILCFTASPCCVSLIAVRLSLSRYCISISVVTERTIIVKSLRVKLARFLAERCNFIAMSSYCHDTLSVCRLSVCDVSVL